MNKQDLEHLKFKTIEGEESNIFDLIRTVKELKELIKELDIKVTLHAGNKEIDYNIEEFESGSGFHCPECGSYMFGSSTNKDKTLTRHCHGNEQWQCDFSFHQSEDEKYMR